MILVFFAVLLMAFLCRGGYLYGSDTDWVSQHSVLPDYFRQKFYQTGNLFPDFAMNLGGGQNIYNFSYYGMFSPIILISYLLPGVSMATYIMASSIVIVLASVCLCFRWLRNNGYSQEITFIATFCFLCAGPLIFHSHRQVPFIDYFPFLLLGLMGIDLYFKTHKKWLLTLSVFLCIMTSYFFSVGCILVLLIYAGYKAVKETRDYRFRSVFQEMLPLIRGILVSILMAAILWLPTLYVIVNGKEGANGEKITILSLVIPPVWAVLYSAYTVGLSIIVLVALIAIVFRSSSLGCKKHETFLASIMLLLLASPIFLYLLNGTLYVRAKALIPFLPLYVLVIAVFLVRMTDYLMNREKVAPHRRKVMVLVLFLLIICDSGVNCIRANIGDKLVSAQEYLDIHDPNKIALIQEALRNDPGYYRMNDLVNSNITCNQVYGSLYNTTSIYTSTCNKEYNKFFYDVLHNPIATRNRLECESSNNIFSQNYLNVKYIVSKTPVTAGYREINQKADCVLYKNDNTLPLAFATSHLMNRTDFDALPFPYNMSALFNNIIVDKDKKLSGKSAASSGFAIHQIDLSSKHLVTENRKNVVIKKKNGRFYINAKNSAAKENASLEIPLDINLKNEILIVSFKVSNKDDQSDLDTFITINGVKNKLSKQSAAYPNGNNNFIYVLSSNQNTKRLKVEFSPGTYEAYHFKAYTLPAAAIPMATGKVDPFVVDLANTGENQIAGDIRVKNNGYFATTLPFDKGFIVTVDGKPENYEQVNTAFVGFPIAQGTHHIVIQYHAPFKQAGMVLSLAGFLLFGTTCAIEKKRNKLKLRFERQANHEQQCESI